MKFAALFLFAWSLASGRQTTEPGPILAPAELGTVEGSVLNSESQPISHARVTLDCMYLTGRAGCEPAKTVLAERDGSFKFDSVVPGNYLLLASAPGFIDIPGKAFATVSVKPHDAVTGVKILLAATGIIRGRMVRANDANEPLSNVQVTALLRYRNSVDGRLRTKSIPSTITAKDGTYAFHDLPPGEYYVYTDISVTRQGQIQQSSRALFHTRIYFPQALDLETASPITVGPGQVKSGIDIRVPRWRAFRISGRISETPQGYNMNQLSLSLARRHMLATAEKGDRIPLQTGGLFSIDGVPPGDYVLRLIGSRPLPQHSGGVPAEIPHLITAQDVEVGSRDIDGIVLTPPPPLTIDGQVKAEAAGDVDLASLTLTLSPVREDTGLGPPLETKPDTNGTFHFANCDPIRYTVYIERLTDLYIASITLNGQDALFAPIDLSGGNGGEMHVVVRGDGGEVDGTVDDVAGGGSTSQTPQSSFIKVLLIGDNFRAESAIEITSATVGNGAFAINDVRPGTYQAVAARDIDMSLLEDKEFMEVLRTLGQTVSVSKRGREHIHLRVIDMREEYEALHTRK